MDGEKRVSDLKQLINQLDQNNEALHTQAGRLEELASKLKQLPDVKEARKVEDTAVKPYDALSHLDCLGVAINSQNILRSRLENLINHLQEIL